MQAVVQAAPSVLFLLLAPFALYVFTGEQRVRQAYLQFGLAVACMAAWLTLILTGHGSDGNIGSLATWTGLAVTAVLTTSAAKQVADTTAAKQQDQAAASAANEPDPTHTQEGA